MRRRHWRTYAGARTDRPTRGGSSRASRVCCPLGRGPSAERERNGHAPSWSRSQRLRQSPRPKPVIDPFSPTTRWQGMTIGMGFRRIAPPTARGAAVADPPRELAVGHRAARAHRPQLFPDRAVEHGGAVRVDLELEVAAFPPEILAELARWAPRGKRRLPAYGAVRQAGLVDAFLEEVDHAHGRPEVSDAERADLGGDVRELEGFVHRSGRNSGAYGCFSPDPRSRARSPRSGSRRSPPGATGA